MSLFVSESVSTQRDVISTEEAGIQGLVMLLKGLLEREDQTALAMAATAQILLDEYGKGNKYQAEEYTVRKRNEFGREILSVVDSDENLILEAERKGHSFHILNFSVTEAQKEEFLKAGKYIAEQDFENINSDFTFGSHLQGFGALAPCGAKAVFVAHHILDSVETDSYSHSMPDQESAYTFSRDETGAITIHDDCEECDVVLSDNGWIRATASPENLADFRELYDQLQAGTLAISSPLSQEIESSVAASQSEADRETVLQSNFQTEIQGEPGKDFATETDGSASIPAVVEEEPVPDAEEEVVEAEAQTAESVHVPGVLPPLAPALESEEPGQQNILSSEVVNLASSGFEAVEAETYSPTIGELTEWCLAAQTLGQSREEIDYIKSLGRRSVKDTGMGFSEAYSKTPQYRSSDIAISSSAVQKMKIDLQLFGEMQRHFSVGELEQVRRDQCDGSPVMTITNTAQVKEFREIWSQGGKTGVTNIHQATAQPQSSERDTGKSSRGMDR